MRQVSNHLLIRMGEEESKLRALVVAQLWKTEWEFAENGASIPGLNPIAALHSQLQANRNFGISSTITIYVR